MSAVCGIDPGLSGALGFVSLDAEFVAVYDMPTLLSTTGRRQVDARGLASLVARHSPRFTLIERVGVRPGEGAVGAFGFGVSYGTILGIFAALGLSHDLVLPAQWKRAAGIPPGSDKRASIAVAKRLLPRADEYLSRVKDDGRAEALILAWQARMKA